MRKRTDKKIAGGNIANDLIKSVISAAQDRIHIKKDGHRAEQDHDKA